MILVYPMLTSESVNPAILPGLIKAVEKYIIVHNMDDVLRNVNNSIARGVYGGVKGVAGTAATAAVAAGVSAYINSKMKRIVKKGKGLELQEQQAQIKGPTTQQEPQQKQKDYTNAVMGAINKSQGNKGTIKDFDMPKYDTVSLEPSWIKVNTDSGAKILGVKVVPFKVTSTTGMVGLLMNDSELKKMSYLANKAGRTVARVFFRAMRGVKLPGFSGKTLSGDPKKDIVWANTQYGKNTFVCFSQLDIEKEDIFTSPQAVQRLHKLGWASLIITDDVNKQATFCMKEFGGICSTIPYSNIFASLGSEQHKVYKDFEDAQRSAGPFFRKKNTTKRKLFSDK